MDKMNVIAFAVVIWTVSGVAANHELCHFKGDKYQCTVASRAELLKLGMPRSACHAHSCDECVKAWRTFITHNHELIEPRNFFVQQEPNPQGALSLMECTRDGLHCACTADAPCSGTSEYCALASCVNKSVTTCNCRLTPAVSTLIHEAEGLRISNPALISFTECVGKPRTNILPRRRHQRHLLSDEEAVFQRENIKVSYNDPIITSSLPGTLVIRVRGMERVITLRNAPYQTSLPPELLELSAELTLIFVTTDGKTLRGALQIVGRTTCRPLQCILCREMLRQLKCLPHAVTYVVYIVLVLISAVTFLYARKVVISIWKLLCGVGIILWKSYRFLRGTTFVAVKTGALTGNALRNGVNQMHEYLERQVARPAAQPPLHGLVLLSLFLLVNGTSAECNAHSIVASKVKECTDSEVEHNCRLTTNAQVTLMNLGHEQCIWFTDQENDHTLFSLKVTYQQANCIWHTTRDYFTHVTTMRYLSQLVCANHETCNWGKGCVRSKQFDALTKQSLDWPGITGCQPSDSGSTSCWIIDSQHCHFFRIWLEADFLRAYDVRRIVSMQCSYQLLIQQHNNDTVETLTVKNQATTSTGITVQVVGSLDQPTQIVNTHLISRVGNPQESYIERASLPSRPMKGHIGDTQSNESMSKNFIFDESMFSCSYYEDSMKCHRQQSYLLSMIEQKKSALPMASAWHQLKVDGNGQLVSELLHSAPIVVNLQFQKYKYSIETRTVCPKFTEAEIKVTGCFACGPLATVEIEAFSSCAAGIVDVHFEKLTVHTRSVKLQTERRTIKINVTRNYSSAQWHGTHMN